MPVSLSPARATALVLVLFLTGVLGGAWAGTAAAVRAQDPYAAVDPVVRTMGLIERVWVDDVGLDTLSDAAVRGMVDSLDRHSTWLPAHVWRDLQRETSGAYTGIGVDVVWRDGQAVIDGVVEGSPAHRDGLQHGDVIVAVDGTPLEGRWDDDGASPLLGTRGEPIVLTIAREGWATPREIRTVRDVVRTPPITSETLDDGVLYVHLPQFRQGTAAALEAALADAGDGLTGVVLDLRDNPGGLLDEAVAVVDLFLDDGPIVATSGRVPSEERSYTARPGSIDAPLAVLVNGLSASGSEIVAAAVQERDRGVVVGTHTYGKGSVQSVFEYPDGSALKLTIARYVTASGEPVAPRTGREPDVEVRWPGDVRPVVALRDALNEADLSEDERAALLELVDALPPTEVRRTRTDIPWHLPVAERLYGDPQLAEALARVRAP